ncbi:MAG: hypothetical protein ABI452_02960 [Candidatus Limnocylindrales bacterium]
MLPNPDDVALMHTRNIVEGCAQGRHDVDLDGLDPEVAYRQVVEEVVR